MEEMAIKWGFGVFSAICPHVDEAAFRAAYEGPVQGITQRELDAFKSVFEANLIAQAHVVNARVALDGGYTPGIFSTANGAVSGSSAVKVVNEWKAENTPRCPSA